MIGQAIRIPSHQDQHGYGVCWEKISSQRWMGHFSKGARAPMATWRI